MHILFLRFFVYSASLSPPAFSISNQTICLFIAASVQSSHHKYDQCTHNRHSCKIHFHSLLSILSSLFYILYYSFSTTSTSCIFRFPSSMYKIPPDMPSIFFNTLYRILQRHSLLRRRCITHFFFVYTTQRNRSIQKLLYKYVCPSTIKKQRTAEAIRCESARRRLKLWFFVNSWGKEL